MSLLLRTLIIKTISTVQIAGVLMAFCGLKKSVMDWFFSNQSQISRVQEKEKLSVTALKSDKLTSAGFTLLELLVVVVILAILAVITLPGYNNAITKSRARTAAADVMALATDLENSFQRTLSYPAGTTTTTAQTVAASIGWNPAQIEFFDYTMIVTATGYDITATGKGAMAGCNITLDEDNVRTVTDPCIISANW